MLFLDTITLDQDTILIKDGIIIGGFIVSSILVVLKYKHDNDKRQTAYENDKKLSDMQLAVLSKEIDDAKLKYEAELMATSHGKIAMRKEMESLVKEKEQILHQRIDRVRDDNIKSYEKLERKIDELERNQDHNTQKILEAINKPKTR